MVGERAAREHRRAQPPRGLGVRRDRLALREHRVTTRVEHHPVQTTPLPGLAAEEEPVASERGMIEHPEEERPPVTRHAARDGRVHGAARCLQFVSQWHSPSWCRVTARYGGNVRGSAHSEDRDADAARRQWRACVSPTSAVSSTSGRLLRPRCRWIGLRTRSLIASLLPAMRSAEPLASVDPVSPLIAPLRSTLRKTSSGRSGRATPGGRRLDQRVVVEAEPLIRRSHSPRTEASPPSWPRVSTPSTPCSGIVTEIDASFMSAASMSCSMTRANLSSSSWTVCGRQPPSSTCRSSSSPPTCAPSRIATRSAGITTPRSWARERRVPARVALREDVRARDQSPQGTSDDLGRTLSSTRSGAPRTSSLSTTAVKPTRPWRSSPWWRRRPWRVTGCGCAGRTVTVATTAVAARSVSAPWSQWTRFVCWMCSDRFPHQIPSIDIARVRPEDRPRVYVGSEPRALGDHWPRP